MSQENHGGVRIMKVMKARSPLRLFPLVTASLFFGTIAAAFAIASSPGPHLGFGSGLGSDPAVSLDLDLNSNSGSRSDVPSAGFEPLDWMVDEEFAQEIRAVHEVDQINSGHFRPYELAP